MYNVFDTEIFGVILTILFFNFSTSSVDTKWKYIILKSFNKYNGAIIFLNSSSSEIY